MASLTTPPTSAYERSLRLQDEVNGIFAKLKTLPDFIHIPRSLPVARERKWCDDVLAGEDGDDGDDVEITGESGFLMHSLQGIVSSETMIATGAQLLTQPLRMIREVFRPPDGTERDGHLLTLLRESQEAHDSSRFQDALDLLAEARAYLESQDKLAVIARESRTLRAQSAVTKPSQQPIASPPPVQEEQSPEETSASTTDDDMTKSEDESVTPSINSTGKVADPREPVSAPAPVTEQEIIADPILSEQERVNARIYILMSEASVNGSADNEKLALIAAWTARDMVNQLLMDSYNTVNTAHPVNALVHSLLGTSAYHLGRNDIALKCHYAALEMRMDFTDANNEAVFVDQAVTFNNLGVCLAAVSRPDEAFVFLSGAFHLLYYRLPDWHPRCRVVIENLEAIRNRAKQ